MNKIELNLIRLLSNSLNSEKQPIDKLSYEEQKELITLAFEQQIFYIILDSINNTIVNKFDNSLLETFSKQKMILALNYQSKLSIIKTILEKCNNEKIDIMVMKGYYYRTLYPNPYSRTMGDVDLYVNPSQFEEACKIIKSFGYFDPYDGKNISHHIAFEHEKYIEIELHHSIVHKQSAHQFNDFNDYIWKKQNKIDIDGIKCTIPSLEDNTVYACMHMLSHFKSRGFGLRQLSDFVLLINSHENFNWNIFLKTTKQFHIFNFISSVINITYKHLNLNVPDNFLYLIDKENIKNTEILLENIFKDGVFGAHNGNTMISLDYKNIDINSKSNKLKSKTQIFFPKSERLGIRYSYAKKHSILLPFAWIHRFIYVLIRKDIKSNEKLPNFNYINQHIEVVKWFEEQ